jgi:hypothetical protein
LDRRVIALVWIGGIALMAAVYWVGPQDFIRVCEAFVSHLWWFLGDTIRQLAERALDAVRAAAIALYAVFLVLAVLARRRGVRSGGAWFIVTVLYLLLVGTSWYDPGTKWLSAAVLAGVGAAVMTARLLHPPPPMSHNPWSAPGYRPMRPPGGPPP